METVRKIRESVCFNQGELAQYLYLSSYFHRLLKDEVRHEQPKQEKLLSLSQKLIDYLNLKLYEICKKNFSLLQTFFKNRTSQRPRICLKGSFENKIIDLFRDTPTTYSTEYPANTNTGFEYVKNTGTYFFCNNIPSMAKDGLYKNSRLDPQKATAYNNFFDFVKIKLPSIGIRNWESCWIKTDEKDSSAYYKSTIIIPLTLKNITLSDLFLELTNFKEIDRAIYGFLCFDHIDTDYFLETDIDIGYIFADLLSLYIITRLNYTIYSKSYMKAIKLLKREQNSFFHDSL